MLRTRPESPVVAPSVLAADFADLAADCQNALDAGGKLLHLDVMDGHFVPNLSFGPGLIEKLRLALPDVCFDVHLMISDPASYIEPFAKAGADHISFHCEVLDVDEAKRLADRVRDLGCTAGIAINPETAFEKVEPLLGSFEMLLVMSVHPGFGGQSFIAEVLKKTARGRDEGPEGLILEMDGGVSPDTAKRCRDAGCDLLVAGSALFGKPKGERSDVVRSMIG
ncbi:MAG: ribulose-phosphate 3-epimerase [Phycisphaera sp.]|nr:MAG: ribulose-phosphate 3-epimerase [Phycisphaera sp.]